MPLIDIEDKEFNRILGRFEDYLTLERGCRQNTLKAYSSDVKSWYLYAASAGFPYTKLTGDAISRFLTVLTVNGRAKSTIQRNAAVLSSFAKFLAYDGVTGSMPLLDPLPKRKEVLPQIMTEGEIQRILNACEDGTPIGKRDRAIIELAYGTGMRASELCGVRLKDIDVSGGLIYTKGKGGKERTIPYVGAVRKIVDDYILNTRPYFEKGHSDWLFLTRTGKPLRREFLWQMLRKRGTSAKIPIARLHPHVLRHTFATHLLRNGMDQRTLQEILGHSSIMTTEKYTHLDNEIMDYYEKYHPRS